MTLSFAQNSHPRHRRSIGGRLPQKRIGPARSGGYVLIFIAAILLFLSSVVLSIATSLREDAQLSMRLRERIQADYTFEAALQYGLAQLAKANAVEAVASSLSDKEKEELDPWIVDHTYEIIIDPEQVDLRFEEAGGLVDANYVRIEEWQRYFEALKLGKNAEGSPEQWAKIIDEARQLAAKSSHSAGFSTMSDMTDLEALPQLVRFGRPEKTEIGEDGREYVVESGIPGLSDAFSIGTASRMLNVQNAPLPLFAALIEANDDQLKKIAEKRAEKQKKLEINDVVQILGEKARSMLTEGRSPFVRVSMSMQTSSGGNKKQTVLVKMENSAYTIVDRGRAS